ncbi:MAG: archease [Propionibacteriales bacterium]|nr:archease [Propionibacteriales bacterium]
MPHTADVRIEAWAPTRERCVAEAVRGAVETFLDLSSARATRGHRRRVAAASDADLLAAVLDEVIYLLDTSGEVPVDVEVAPADGDLDVRFATVDVETLAQIGAVPKAVSLHELTLESGPDGWSCSVTLDV